MEEKRGSLVISYFGQGQRSLQTIEQLVADDRERNLLLSSELWLKKRTRQCSGVNFLKRPESPLLKKSRPSWVKRESFWQYSRQLVKQPRLEKSRSLLHTFLSDYINANGFTRSPNHQITLSWSHRRRLRKSHGSRDHPAHRTPWRKPARHSCPPRDPAR